VTYIYIVIYIVIYNIGPGLIFPLCYRTVGALVKAYRHMFKEDKDIWSKS